MSEEENRRVSRHLPTVVETSRGLRISKHIPSELSAALMEETRFSKKELKRLYYQFRRISNKTGQLDRDGFRKSMGILGMVQDSLLCQRLFSEFNTSMTGRISFREFALGLGVLVKGTVDEKLDFAFNMTDIDKSGDISLDEWILSLESMMRM